jgi:hypothetical protein
MKRIVAFLAFALASLVSPAPAAHADREIIQYPHHGEGVRPCQIVREPTETVLIGLWEDGHGIESRGWSVFSPPLFDGVRFDPVAGQAPPSLVARAVVEVHSNEAFAWIWTTGDHAVTPLPDADHPYGVVIGHLAQGERVRVRHVYEYPAAPRGAFHFINGCVQRMDRRVASPNVDGFTGRAGVRPILRAVADGRVPRCEQIAWSTGREAVPLRPQA